MISDIFAIITGLLVENCTGIALVKSYDGNRRLDEPLITERSVVLQEFTEFDQSDCIFQEFDPPENHEEADPRAWRHSLPSFTRSLKECLKTVLLIQTVCGSVIGLFGIGIAVIDFTFGEWCYEVSADQWNSMPMNVQILRVTTRTIEASFIEMWNFTCIAAIFPFSLIKDLHLLTLSILAAFIDISYRLYLQLLGLYGDAKTWKVNPLNVFFIAVIVLSNYLVARHFHPRSLKSTIKLDFILSAQFILALPIGLISWNLYIPWYLQQDEHIKVVLASCSPILSVVPKLICRLGAQTTQGIFHPGTAHVLVLLVYVPFAVVYRIMQSDLKGFSYFVGLGIAHAAIDLIERITITMRDHIWEYLYRLVRRQRRPLSKYRSPRSRRFIADMSIQIMLQETSGLVSVLGFMAVYEALYTREKPFIDRQIIMEFCKRATAGLAIDLFFNTISLLIQTRVMNIAVCRVWKMKWLYHVIVNCLIFMISVTYCSEYFFAIVQNKYDHKHYANNCTFPDFLK